MIQNNDNDFVIIIELHNLKSNNLLAKLLLKHIYSGYIPMKTSPIINK